MDFDIIFDRCEINAIENKQELQLLIIQILKFREENLQEEMDFDLIQHY
jgi:hypothetical protein